MAKIISMSLSKDILDSLDGLQKSSGFSGRSEVLRAGLRLLHAEQNELSVVKGVIDAVLLITHTDHETKELSLVYHKYLDLIKTQVHNHCGNHKCLEVFVLHGDVKKMRSMMSELNASKKVQFAKLIML